MQGAQSIYKLAFKIYDSKRNLLRSMDLKNGRRGMENPKSTGEIFFLVLFAISIVGSMNCLGGKRYFLFNRIRKILRGRTISIWEKRPVCPRCGRPNYKQRVLSDATSAACDCPDCGWSGVG